MDAASRRPRVALETLGCKLNQYETDAIATDLRSRGYEIVDGTGEVDVRVVNSCTVTNKADRKSRNALYRAQRAGSRLVIMTGCGVDSGAADSSADLSTYLVDNARKNRIPDIIDAHFAGEIVDPAVLEGSPFAYAAPERIFHTRTSLKIQDGCDNFCTFCIIPYVRGRAASRSADGIVHEAEEALENGAREIVLTGVNMSRYRDGDTDFAALAARILAIEGRWRMRISSLEPDGLDERFFALFDHERMTPQLHLCLQSGSERVLLAMRRMYTVAAYRDAVGKLRDRDPLFNLTTDLIVGFPGETEVDHDASLATIDEFGFGHVHMFPYSVRSGTRAERMADHVPHPVARRRAREVERRAARARRGYRASLVGREDTVLIERIEENGRASGLGRYYTRVTIEAVPDARPNTFVPVTLTGLGEGDDPTLIGEVRSA